MTLIKRSKSYRLAGGPRVRNLVQEPEMNPYPNIKSEKEGTERLLFATKPLKHIIVKAIRVATGLPERF